MLLEIGSSKKVLLRLLLILISLSGYFLYRAIPLGTAYKAKVLCSGVFVSGRSSKSILTNDIEIDSLAFLRFFNASIDRENRSVTSSTFGLFERKAIFRPGLGCTLLIGESQELLHQNSALFVSQIAVSQNSSDVFLDETNQTELQPSATTINKLNQVLDDAFSEPPTKGFRQTRAMIVVLNGRIIAERYSPEFSSDSALAGWSMAKSVVNALVGIAVREGKLSLQDRALLPEWRGKGDQRANITLDMLLRMTDGLDFSENYSNPLDDVTNMLLGVGNASGYAIHKRLAASPGQRWSYSSGTTNILAKVLRYAYRGSDWDYLTVPRTELFDRLGMYNAIIEPDASGTFVGSSFMYATARDWARLGCLYLQDGVWNGNRILPEGWVAYSTTPTPQSANGEYGAHFWLKINRRSEESKAIALPKNAYFSLGYEGQLLAVVPSHNLVIVRLGLTTRSEAWSHAAFVFQVLRALEG